MVIFHYWIVVCTNTPWYVHIEAEVSMVDLASSKCFTKLCTIFLTLTEPRANAQLVVKSVVIPNQDPRTNSKRTAPQSTYNTCSDFHLLGLLRRPSIAISSPHRQINRAMPEVRRAACMVCLLLYVVGGLGPKRIVLSAVSRRRKPGGWHSVNFGSTLFGQGSLVPPCLSFLSLLSR